MSPANCFASVVVILKMSDVKVNISFFYKQGITFSYALDGSFALSLHR